jgi:hypothetical protein
MLPALWHLDGVSFFSQVRQFDFFNFPDVGIYQKHIATHTNIQGHEFFLFSLRQSWCYSCLNAPCKVKQRIPLK